MYCHQSLWQEIQRRQTKFQIKVPNANEQQSTAALGTSTKGKVSNHFEKFIIVTGVSLK